jgi:hypothetical protein
MTLDEARALVLKEYPNATLHITGWCWSIFSEKRKSKGFLLATSCISQDRTWINAATLILERKKNEKSS